MSPALLLLAFFAQPECRVNQEQASRLVTHIVEAEKKHQLPNGILAAVVLAESGGRNKISHTQDYGPAQIHGKPGLTIRENLMVGARLLSKSRNKCSKMQCRCIWAFYNWHSKSWCRRVKTIHQRILGYGQDNVA